MNLNKFFHESVGVMLDLETDGKNSCENSITSICLTKFSLETGTVFGKLHFKFSEIIGNGISDEGTMAWREQNKVDLYEGSLEAFTIKEGLKQIALFISAEKNQGLRPIMFANHTEFDVGFLSKYHVLSCLEIPWAYRDVFDLSSLLLGAGKMKSDISIEVLSSLRWKTVRQTHFSGRDIKHDAFYDTVFQIEILMLGLK